MALLTLGDRRVLSAEITMPYRGVWQCRAMVDGSVTPGDVTIRCGAIALAGTLLLTDLHQFVDRTEVTITGGKATFSENVEAQEFVAPTLELVVKSTLGVEALSSTSDKAWLARQIPRWVRLAGSRAQALDAIVKTNSGSWRVLDDGSVWIGEDSWAAGTEIAYLESDTDQRLTWSEDTPTARPGTTVRSQKIKAVKFSFSSSRFRTTAEYGSVDLGENVGKLVKALAPLDWYALYPATVLSQSGDTLDVKPDRDDIPSLTKVPIRTGVPGLQVKVPSGSKIMLGFESGNPQAPFAALWSFGATTEITETADKVSVVASSQIKLDSTDVLVGAGASVFTGDMAGLIAAINQLVTSINVNVVAYNAVVPIPGTPLGSVSPQVPLVPIIPTPLVSTKVKVAL